MKGSLFVIFFQHFCFYFQSPGRDSPGDDSSASIVTVESTSSGGCRNSTTSLDSGRASNSNSNSTTTDSSFHSIHPIREHPYPVRGNSLGLPPPPVSHMGRMSSIGSVGSSSFRQSYHSSSSSLGSVERAEDSICALDIQEMTADGVPVRKSLTSGFKVPFIHSKVFFKSLHRPTNVSSYKKHRTSGNESVNGMCKYGLKQYGFL